MKRLTTLQVEGIRLLYRDGINKQTLAKMLGLTYGIVATAVHDPFCYKDTVSYPAPLPEKKALIPAARAREQQSMVDVRFSSLFGADAIPVNAKAEARMVLINHVTSGRNLITLRQRMRRRGLNVPYLRRGPKVILESNRRSA